MDLPDTPISRKNHHFFFEEEQNEDGNKTDEEASVKNKIKEVNPNSSSIYRKLTGFKKYSVMRKVFDHEGKTKAQVFCEYFGTSVNFVEKYQKILDHRHILQIN